MHIPARREPNPERVLSSRAGVVIPGRVVNPAAGVNPGWLVAHPSEQNWVLHNISIPGTLLEQSCIFPRLASSVQGLLTGKQCSVALTPGRFFHG